MHVTLFGLLLALFAASAADVPPPPTPSRAGSAASKRAAAKPAARPALQCRGALADLGADAGADEADVVEVVEAASDDATADDTAAVEARPFNLAAILPQLGTLAIILLVRFGISAYRSFFKDRPLPMGDLSALPVLGGAFRLAESIHAKFTKFAQEPSSAPVMIGLLIVATKLVARMDARLEAKEAEAAEAEVALGGAADDGADGEADEEEGDEADGEADSKAVEEDDGDEDGDDDDDDN